MAEFSRTRAKMYDEPIRGRSRGRSNSNEALLKSTVLIARKYDLDPKLLIDSFVEAWRNKMHQYEGLTISSREVNQEFAIFLITNDDKVVSQFPIKLEVLRNLDYFKNRIQSFPKSDYTKGNVEQKQKKIGELRFGIKGINVKAKIVDIAPKRLVVTRFGTQAYVSNVKIADDTGSIMLSLWNVQIDQVHVGDEVEIENCHVSSFAGEPQLRIGRKGMITVTQHFPTPQKAQLSISEGTSSKAGFY